MRIEMEPITIFDKILKKEIPAQIVYEDNDILAFKDIAPKAPVHVLVIPKTKIRSLAEIGILEDLKVAKFIKKISVVAQQLGLDSKGYRVIFNCGKEGGQTVDYIHAHILGGRQLDW